MLELVILLIKLIVLALTPVLLGLAAIVGAILRWLARTIAEKANRGR